MWLYACVDVFAGDLHVPDADEGLSSPVEAFPHITPLYTTSYGNSEGDQAHRY